MLARKLASVFVRDAVMRVSLGDVWRIQLTEEIPVPAHLFMIRSNIKLTWPGESIGIGGYDFCEQSQWDRGNLGRSVRINFADGHDILDWEAENAHDRCVTPVRQQPQNPPRGGRRLPRLSSLERRDADRVRRRPATSPDHAGR